MGAKNTAPGEEPQGMLARGLSILEALSHHPDGASVTDVARDVGLPMSTTHRLLSTETSLGYVAFDPERKTYRLGMRVFELANRVRAVTDLGSIAQPVMRELSRRTGETTQLAVLSNARALFLEKVGTEQAVGIRGAVGQSEPLYATSTGKTLLSQLPDDRLTALLDEIDLAPWSPTTITSRDALLGELDRVRSRDYATADEEFDQGVRAIAVPVRDGRDVTRAALCISAPAFRVSMQRLTDWLPDLQAAAREIGVQLPLQSPDY
ncbi:IclR family transcriptional regulator [Microbacterium sp. cf332]|uniref:IclR family transcriptional regulator n=1 Tax=Microbacterium sp. cf332 TaxID=1761804 RepID=UPI0008885A21|nr:IclR family transcriptional regulator [Microbacterium sp. cf332]SDQ94740.1 transcriptional regulator, IclR family [Microbacterium sp. cf332]